MALRGKKHEEAFALVLVIFGGLVGAISYVRLGPYNHIQYTKPFQLFGTKKHMIYDMF